MEVLENSPIGITIYDKIVVTDVDSVGDNLDITCYSGLEQFCEKYK